MGEKNYIAIYKQIESNPQGTNFNFSVKNSWFSKPFSIFVFYDRIEFKRIGTYYEGKNIHCSTHSNYGWSTFGLNNELLKVGCFYIDMDESNEDIKVVYWEDERIKNN
jgi:hypothetical protein